MGCCESKLLASQSADLPKMLAPIGLADDPCKQKFNSLPEIDAQEIQRPSIQTLRQKLSEAFCIFEHSHNNISKLTLREESLHLDLSALQRPLSESEASDEGNSSEHYKQKVRTKTKQTTIESTSEFNGLDKSNIFSKEFLSQSKELEKELFYIDTCQIDGITFAKWTDEFRLPFLPSDFSNECLLRSEVGFYGALALLRNCWRKWEIGLCGYKKVEGGIGLRVFINGIKRMFVIKNPIPTQPPNPTPIQNLIRQLPSKLQHPQLLKIGTWLYILTGWLPQTINISNLSKQEIVKRLELNYDNQNILVSFNSIINNQAFVVSGFDIKGKVIKGVKFVIDPDHIKYMALAEEWYKFQDVVMEFPVLNINWNPQLYAFSKKLETCNSYQNYKLQVPASSSESQLRVIVQPHICTLTSKNPLKISIRLFELETNQQIDTLQQLHQEQLKNIEINSKIASRSSEKCIQKSKEKDKKRKTQEDPKLEGVCFSPSKSQEALENKSNDDVFSMDPVRSMFTYSDFLLNELFVFQKCTQVSQYALEVKISHQGNCQTQGGPCEICLGKLQVTVDFYSFYRFGAQILHEPKLVSRGQFHSIMTPEKTGFAMNSPYFNKNLHYSLTLPQLQNQQLHPFRCRIKFSKSSSCSPCPVNRFQSLDPFQTATSTPTASLACSKIKKKSNPMIFQLYVLPNHKQCQDLTMIKPNDVSKQIFQSEEFQDQCVFQFVPRSHSFILVFVGFTFVNALVHLQVQLFDVGCKSREGVRDWVDMRLVEMFSDPQFLYQHRFQWKESSPGPRRRTVQNSKPIFYPIQTFKKFFQNPHLDYSLPLGSYQFNVSSQTFKKKHRLPVDPCPENTQQYSISLFNASPPSLSLAIFQLNQDGTQAKIICDDTQYVPMGIGVWTDRVRIGPGKFRFVFAKLEAEREDGVFRVRALQ